MSCIAVRIVVLTKNSVNVVLIEDLYFSFFLISMFLQCVQPTVVIHSAAERRPDVVEKQAEATHSLNVSATQFVCQGAGGFSCVQFKVGMYVLEKAHVCSTPSQKCPQY